MRCLIYTMCTENSSAMAPVYTFEQITECYISYFDNGISLRFEFDSGADFFFCPLSKFSVFLDFDHSACDVKAQLKHVSESGCNKN